MLELPGDYLKKKAAQLGLDRELVITAVQELLDARWPGQARVRSYNDGVLRIATQSAPLASEIRFRQLELLKEVRKTDAGVASIAVTIG